MSPFRKSSKLPASRDKTDYSLHPLGSFTSMPFCSLAMLTLSHVLCDDVDRFLGHHGVQLNQLFVSQFLHDLSLLEESLRGHGAGL